MGCGVMDKPVVSVSNARRQAAQKEEAPMKKDDPEQCCAGPVPMSTMKNMEGWWLEHRHEFYKDWPMIEVMETFIDAYVLPHPVVAAMVTRVAYSLYIDAESDRLAAGAFFKTYAKAKAEKRLRREGADAAEFCVAVNTRGALPPGYAFPAMHGSHKVVHIVE